MPRGGRRLSKYEVDAMLRRLFPPKPEEGWTGPVIRNDPKLYQKPPIIEIARCRQRYCGHWTPIRFVYCQVCHQPRDGSAPATP